MLVIQPYKSEGVWAFDDEALNLVREPFIMGIDTMLDWLADKHNLDRAGFNLSFSTQPFPRYHIKLTWMREENGGNWYTTEEPKMEGWLCPAMYLYFDHAPSEIYIRAERSA